jgi:hypothetical protein
MSHEYPDRIVDLVLWHASIASGEPRGLDGQQLQWVSCQSLGNVGCCPPICRSSRACSCIIRAPTER